METKYIFKDKELTAIRQRFRNLLIEKDDLIFLRFKYKNQIRQDLASAGHKSLAIFEALSEASRNMLLKKNFSPPLNHYLV